MIGENIKYLSISLFLVFATISCTAPNKLADNGNTRTYSKDIEMINNYLLKIIRNSSKLVIKDAINKSNGRVYILSKRVWVQKTAGHSDNASRVYIRKVNHGKATSIKIENPDYPFGYPQFKKVDYQLIIFNELKKMLKQK